jgi:hypothetical protein
MPRCRIALICAVKLLPIGRSQCQLAELQPPAHIRMRAANVSPDRLTGIVAAWRTDSVTIVREAPSPLTLAIADITELEIFRGRSAWRGAEAGSKVGFLVGLSIGLISHLKASACGDILVPCKSHNTAERIYVGALSGLVAGGTLGAVIKADHWDPVELPVRVVAGHSMRTGGMTIALLTRPISFR